MQYYVPQYFHILRAFLEVKRKNAKQKHSIYFFSLFKNPITTLQFLGHFFVQILELLFI